MNLVNVFWKVNVETNISNSYHYFIFTNWRIKIRDAKIKYRYAKSSVILFLT